MRHFFFPCANRGASLVHAHVRRKGGKITGPGVQYFCSNMWSPGAKQHFCSKFLDVEDPKGIFCSSICILGAKQDFSPSA